MIICDWCKKEIGVQADNGWILELPNNEFNLCDDCIDKIEHLVLDKIGTGRK